jgi:sugar phosphate isomerase/epimerase
MVLSGAASDNPAADRRTIVEGLKAAADTAGEVGVELGFEAIRKDAGSIISTLPETLGILEDIGAPNIRIIFDSWHFWDLPDILDDLQKHADQFICIQINDRGRPRSWPTECFRATVTSTCRASSERWTAVVSRVGTTWKSSRTMACGATHIQTRFTI